MKSTILNYCYDVEIFPNCFTVIFADLNDYLRLCEKYDIKKVKVSERVATYKKIIAECSKFKYVIHDEFDGHILNLVAFLNRPMYLYGFNNSNYDRYMLIGFLSKFRHCATPKELVRYLYRLNQTIVSFERNANDSSYGGVNIWNHPDTKHLAKTDTMWRDIDIMKIFALDKVGKSAKQLCMNLMWWQVKDYSMPDIEEGVDDHFYDTETYDLKYLSEQIPVWDRFVTLPMVRSIIDYNENDVFIVAEAIRFQAEEVRLRFKISQKYDVDVLSDSRSKIADKLIEKFYEDFTGIPRDMFIGLRTERRFIRVAECISPVVKFETPEFNAVLNEYKSKTVYNTKSELSHSFTFRNTTYQLGTGGLHSKDEPGIFKTTNTYIIRDADVTSFYPYIILNFGICPKHLDKDAWYDIMKFIITERVNAKHSGDTVTAGALKIVVNSGGFGKLGFEYSFMYDRKAMVQVTVMGQMLLLMLIEKLELNGIHVISANTDGIVCQIPRELESVYAKCCDEWCNMTKFELEYTDYSDYIRADVNNYLALKPGKIEPKRKGSLNYRTPLEDYQKGYDKPIIALAVENYFLKGKAVMDTLKECEDILMFCGSQKIAKKFNVSHTVVVDGEIQNLRLEKHTRYFVSNEGGIIRKLEDGKQVSSICSGESTVILNELDDRPITDYDIKYRYYYNEAMKIIYSIQAGTKNKKQIKKQTGMIGGLFDGLV